ncbi:8025_t:CDS:2, partial [Racocetra persica]
LGGAVSTLFMIVGCICEFFFIPLNTDNLLMLSRRLICLFIILAINTAPTYYIVIKARTTQISLIIGIVQLVISLLTTLTFATIPSASLFGRPSKCSQKYQTFKAYTASYPILNRTDRATSIGLWCCVFSCKMIESYFFLALSFKDPLKAMVNSRVLDCGDRLVEEYFPSSSEAERRILFFAQSLSTSIPNPLPVQNMPTFTVLTPHYSEKILLSLREVIREEDHNTRVTLIEYLKQLHPIEWDNFVKDTKFLAEERNLKTIPNQFENDYSRAKKNKKLDDLPFYSVGFKSSAPEFTLRTRIWASLRTQTLYRTISGFMNYSKAIKLLYSVENPQVSTIFSNNQEKLEEELNSMANRKF